MILYNPKEAYAILYGHSAVHCFVTNVVKYTSSVLQKWAGEWDDYQILLKSPPLNLLAGSAPESKRGHSSFWIFL